MINEAMGGSFSAPSSLAGSPVLGSSASATLRTRLQAAWGNDEQEITLIHHYIEEILQQLDVRQILGAHTGPELIFCETTEGRLPVFVKEADFSTAYREELAYRVSEKLGFHVVPPTLLKDNVVMQLWIPSYREGPPINAGNDGDRAVSSAAAVFRYIVNQPGNDPEDTIWTTSGQPGQSWLMLINHGRAFSVEGSRDRDAEMEALHFDDVFTQAKWEHFLSISDNDWEALLSQEQSVLSAAEKTEFLRRIDHLKVVVLNHINTNRSTLSPVVIDMRADAGFELQNMLDNYGISIDESEHFLPCTAANALLEVDQGYRARSASLTEQIRKVVELERATASSSSRRRSGWLGACLPCLAPVAENANASPPWAANATELSLKVALERRLTQDRLKKESAFPRIVASLSRILSNHGVDHASCWTVVARRKQGVGAPFQ